VISRWMLSWLALSLFVASTVAWGQCLTAQSSNANWNYDDPSVHIYWEYAVAVDPPPAGFRLKIGTAPQQYTITRDMPATQFHTSLKSVVPGPAQARYYAGMALLYHAEGMVCRILNGVADAGCEEGSVGAECPFGLSLPSVRLGLKKSP
jgi:hypothetical protein